MITQEQHFAELEQMHAEGKAIEKSRNAKVIRALRELADEIETESVNAEAYTYHFRLPNAYSDEYENDHESISVEFSRKG